MSKQSTRSERIIGGIVRGLGAAVIDNAIDRHVNPAIDTNKKQFFVPPPDNGHSVTNSFIRNTLRILNDVPFAPLQEDYFRTELLKNLVSPSDTLSQGRIKYKNVQSIRESIAMVKSGNRPRAASAVAGTSQAVKLAGRGAYNLRNLGVDISGLAGYGIGGALGTAAGATLGSLPGGLTGAKIGSTIGQGIGHEIGSAIFGRGAYTVAKNSIMKSGNVLSEGVEIPSFIDSNRFTRIMHREFVQDIVVPATATAFTNLSFVINPGNAALFPWLSAIAANYQQYEIMGMVVCFKSTSTDFSTSGALGSVVLATNYDVLESPFVSKVIMENSQYAVSAKPSLSQMHAIECDPKLTTVTTKYIRNASSSFTLSQDNRFYDHGLFQLATVGLSATAGTVLGELWVTYDIKLLKPEIANSVSLTQGQHIVSGGVVSKAAIFGTAPTSVGANYAAATTNTLTFSRVGQFLVEVEAGGTVLIDPGESAVGLTFTEVVNITTSTPSELTIYTVGVTVPGQTLTFDYSGSATVSASAVRIASYASVNA